MKSSDLEALKVLLAIAEAAEYGPPGAKKAIAQAVKLIAQIEAFLGNDQHIHAIAHQQLRLQGEVVLVSITEKQIREWLLIKHSMNPTQDALNDAIDHGSYMMEDYVVQAAKDDFLDGLIAKLKDDNDD